MTDMLPELVKIGGVSSLFIALIISIYFLLLPVVNRKKRNSNIKKNIPAYIIGTLLFFAYLFILSQLGILDYFPNFIITITFLVISTFILSYLLSLFSLYLGIGFFMGLPSFTLIVASFFAEIIIHPPDEE